MQPFNVEQRVQGASHTRPQMHDREGFHFFLFWQVQLKRVPTETTT